MDAHALPPSENLSAAYRRPYRGRFAPSPTGPLHFGSMVAAIASYVDARAHGGEWLVRIEDVDEPRTVPGAADQILRTLEAFGLEWTGEVVWQSRRKHLYRDALDGLTRAGSVYPCGCTRKEVEESGAGGVYPGTCRAGIPNGRQPRAWRVRVPDQTERVVDRWQGEFSQHLPREAGDFVLLRADGYFAYQLAVVVDDAAQGVTDVVRGADLLDSTPRQQALQRLLGVPAPRYAHVRVAVDAAGNKLSKQTGAQPVRDADAPGVWREVLKFLGYAPPADFATAEEARAWAVANWRK